MPRLRDDKPPADWFSWGLHFLFGLLGGGFVCAVALLRRMGSGEVWTMDRHTALALGVGLLAASALSYKGDEFWDTNSYRVIPPDEMRHSNASRVVSIASGIVGALLITFSLLRRTGVL